MCYVGLWVYRTSLKSHLSLSSLKMKVFLLSAYLRNDPDSEWNKGCLIGLTRSAHCSEHSHRLADNPDEADIILFCDPGPLPLSLSIFIHPIFRKYSHKCFLYNEDDLPAYWCRGFLVSGSYSQISPGLHQGAAYVRNGLVAWTRQLPFPEGDQFLFSFVGSSETHIVRKNLMRILAGSDSACLIDASRSITQAAFMAGDEEAIQWLRNQFINACSRSLFVLCPRGVGASSIRLFEVMSMGRAPVVISDNWIPPFGANWDEFLIKIPEDDLAAIPTILLEKRPLAYELGAKAREAWKRWYSPESHFQTLVEACEMLLAEPNAASHSKSTLFGEVFSPAGLRIIARYVRQRLSVIRSR